MKRFHVFLFVLVMVGSLLLCSCAGADNKEDLYREANRLMSDSAYEDAAAKFTELGQYEDASLLAMYCRALNAAENGRYGSAVSGFSALGDFRDCSILSIYYAALSYEAAEEYEKAQDLLAPILYFKDSNERLLSYGEKIKARDYRLADEAEKAGKLDIAIKGFKALGDYSDSPDRVTALQEKINARDYAAAEAEENKGNLEKALEGFVALKDYSDSAERAETVREKIRARDYDAADLAEKNGDYAAALEGFTKLGDYRDSKERALAVKDKGMYAQGMDLALAGKYEEAYKIFTDLGDYEDSEEKAYALGVCNFAKITNKGNGIAAFEFHEKYGLININKNITVSPNWDSIDEFDENGLAIATNNEKYGYINNEGETIIACDWDQISPYAGNICTVAKKSGNNHLFGLYDTTGKEITPAQWRTLGSSNNSDWDSKYGNYVHIYTPVLNEGKIKVQNPEGLWGFIDAEGKPVGEVRWESIENFSENAAVIIEKGKYGYLNKDGSVLIEPQYQEAYSFSGGLAAVKTNGKWGYIDQNNSFVIQPLYGQAMSFNDGYAHVFLSGTGWQIIDAKGSLQYFISGKTKADYELAVEYLNNEQYSEAYSIFAKLVGYKDSNAKAVEAKEKALAAGSDMEEGDVAAEIYAPPLVARIGYADTSWNVMDWESSVTVDKPGTYTISSNIASTGNGLAVLGVYIYNEDQNDINDIFMTGRCIRIDEILVNGKAVSFEKNYTCQVSGTNSDGTDYRYVYTSMYRSWAEAESDGTAVCWDGDSTSPQFTIVDLADFESVDSLQVTFTYGIFK